MRKLLIAAMSVALGAASASAQSIDDLNIQIHGYATQGFLYTSQNNILTTSSSEGSPAWSEAVVNVGAQPAPGLRVAVQARYFVLGNFGNTITLDWAAIDYKVNDRFGIRAGKVKTPSGLFNETQDIDPSYLWSLLPQGIYPIGSRNSDLSHNGGVVYGNIDLSKKLGKLEYRGWGGQRVLKGDDGYFVSQVEAGTTFPYGLTSSMYGAALRWKTPVRGLMIGGSDIRSNEKNYDQVSSKGVSSNGVIHPYNKWAYFAKYEHGKVMAAAEVSRYPLALGKPVFVHVDQRMWYAMASYKVSEKFSAGVYQSQFVNHASKLGAARYQKDWAISGRYDFNQFIYAKAEQHFIDGTGINYDTLLNPHGLKPDTRMTILKIGVSF